MATTYAPQSHPSSLDGPVSFYRLIGVLRTGRMETAVAPQQRRNSPLIESDQEQQDGAHGLPFSGPALVWVQLSYEQSCPAKEARKGGVDLRIRCLPNWRTGYYDTVPSRLNPAHTQPYRFTHPSLDTVPYNGIAYAAAYRESEPTVWKAILQNAQNSEAVAIRLSRPADLLEPAVVPYSIASFQAAALPKDSVCFRVRLVGRASRP